MFIKIALMTRLWNNISVESNTAGVRLNMEVTSKQSQRDVTVEISNVLILAMVFRNSNKTSQEYN